MNDQHEFVHRFTIPGAGWATHVKLAANKWTQLAFAYRLFREAITAPTHCETGLQTKSSWWQSTAVTVVASIQPGIPLRV